MDWMVSNRKTSTWMCPAGQLEAQYCRAETVDIAYFERLHLFHGQLYMGHLFSFQNQAKS